jgi:hypothetical protein
MVGHGASVERPGVPDRLDHRERSAAGRPFSAKVVAMRGKHRRRRPWWQRPGPLLLIIAVAVGAAAGIWSVTRSLASGTQAVTASTSTSEPLPTSGGGASSLPEPATSLEPATTVAIGSPVSAPGSLMYTMAAGAPIQVVAVNPCWIEVRDTAGAPVTRVTTLQAGQTLSLTSPVWMRLGNPANVHVTVETTALQLPTGPGDLIITSA